MSRSTQKIAPLRLPTPQSVSTQVPNIPNPIDGETAPAQHNGSNSATAVNIGPVSLITTGILVSSTDNVYVYVSGRTAAAAATSANGMLVKATDPPLYLAIGPGTYLSIISVGASPTGVYSVAEVAY